MRVFLAGCEDKDWTLRVLAGCRSVDDKPANMLSSYFYSKLNASTQQNLKWLDIYNKLLDQNWIMDSGLFTMMFGAGKGKKLTDQELCDYTDKYIAYLNQIQYKHVAVEMDVHKISGLALLKKLRAKFERGFDVNRTIMVWHIEEKIKGLIELGNRYPYIALSIPELRIVAKANKKDLFTMVMSLIRVIEKNCNKPKIHLLGCTQESLILNDKYFSCDSTSWMSGVRYNQVKIFNGKKFICTNFTSKGFEKLFELERMDISVQYQNLFQKYGVSMNVNQYSLRSSIQAKQFRKMENFINERHS